MMKPKISKGYRKYLRQRKSEIRRQTWDFAEQKKLISELYSSVKEQENKI